MQNREKTYMVLIKKVANSGDYRLTRAAGFLIEGEETVTAVAQRCGFDNLSYFNRLFRRKYGMTPGEYRSCRHPSETGKLLVPGDEIC